MWQGTSNAFEALPLTLIEIHFDKYLDTLNGFWRIMVSVWLFWVLGMIVVEGLAVDGIRSVVHPDLTKSREFEQALHNLRVVV